MVSPFPGRPGGGIADTGTPPQSSPCEGEEAPGQGRLRGGHIDAAPSLSLMLLQLFDGFLALFLVLLFGQQPLFFHGLQFFQSLPRCP